MTRDTFETTDGQENSDGDDAMACERHEIESLPTGYGTCPLCNQERRLEAERMHRLTRDPTKEPW